MKLLSDAIPGSGEGLAGIIDGDITYDEFGIPFIPAKRIKGILKESARDLKDAGLLKSLNFIDDFFGETGKKNGTEFKISDGHLPDYEEIRNFLKTCTISNTYKELRPIFNREAVLNYYSYTRSQTTINDKGVAEPNSLRTFRILKKGLKFSFDLVFPDGFEEDFKNMLAVTRLFGTSRTRGAGEIRLELKDGTESQIEEKSENEKVAKFEENDICTIKLTIHNIGQLLVSSQVGKTQVSENYIPGSFILGAIAGKFIAQKKQSSKHYVPNNDNDFKAMFLHGAVSFSNGYPMHQEDGTKRVYYPTPKSFVKEKDKENHFDLTDPNNLKNITNEKIQTKGSIGDFIEIGGQTVTSYSSITEMEYHHARPSKDRSIGHATEDAGKFFQFNVIRADQYFQSSITGEYRYLKEIIRILEQENIFFLGKSKTAQYGKCTFDFEVQKQKSNSNDQWENDGEAVITLRSDLILRNENGANVADPNVLVDELKNALGFKSDSNVIELKQSFLDVKKVGGFLGVWNMPKIQALALAAGSELVCANKTGDPIDVKKLENRSYGCRNEEGFGQIIIDWHNKMTIKDVNKPENKFGLPKSFLAAKDLVHHILDKELETVVVRYAVDQFNSFRGISLTNSFMGRLKLLVNHASDVHKLNSNFKFSKRAFDQLAKLEKYWPLQKGKDQNNKDVFEVDLKGFALKLLEIQKPNEIPNLREIMNKAGIVENYHQDNEDIQLKMFKLFANHFLTLARLHNRKEENNG